MNLLRTEQGLPKLIVTGESMMLWKQLFFTAIYIYTMHIYIYMYIQYLFYHDAKEAGGWLVVWVQTRCFKRYPMCLDTFVI